jgi:hypothetical protein
MRRLGIGLPICAVVLLALLVPGAATAAGPCGSTILKGHRFTYKVISGSATCAEARYALGWWIGAFGSKSGYPPGWTCFNAHGNALLVSKEVAHCYRPNGLNPESVAKLFDPTQPDYCGTIRGEVALYGVMASRTSCLLARRVARTWRASVFAGRCSRFFCRALGFRCRAKPPARVNYEVGCASGKRRVSFELSVD